MSIAVNADARVKSVTVTDDLITFHLVDGRVISVPLVWFDVGPMHSLAITDDFILRRPERRGHV